MVYQGSKAKLAKDIVPIIQYYIKQNHITDYYELFVGGANVIDKVSCKNRHGFDINEYLIELLRYAQSDTSLSLAPDICTEEHYREVRKAYNNNDFSLYSKAYIGIVGFCASYSSKFWGGYARVAKDIRNMYKERIRNLKAQSKYLQDIDFQCSSYTELDISKYKNCLFYLDPPYRDTTKYSKQSIDYDYFYKFCKDLAKQNTVLISEFYMPNDFTVIWEKSRNVNLTPDGDNRKSKIERLYLA